ncbi:helix-turn-helix transcriptional regulator [Rubrivirga sp. IMCC43871]|uniref:helix-turn-helix transcriptional regulator n=1 Tax=Rubrivirga sp. IMCC43871 TaxID=3391575 RepID=UPI0039901C2C
MALTLSSDDLARLRAAQNVLLAPLAAPSVEGWAARVVETLVDVFGADGGLMALPYRDTPVVERGLSRGLAKVFDHFVVEPQAAGEELLDPTMERCTRVRLAHDVHALSYARIDHFLAGALKHSAYYHETRAAHPHREAAVLIADLRRDGEAVEGAVHLYFGVASRFGDATLDVQDLLVPALDAGVGAALDLGARRAALDALDAPLVVCDVDGRAVHESAALTAALADDARAAHVRAEARRLAADLAGPGVATSPERAVRTGRGTYGLRATVLPEGAALSPRPAVLVAVRPPADPWPSADVLRQRFALTRREAEVAGLLARGLANDTVAHALCISPHTARRHTERVMGKLAVSSRSRVAAAILAPSPAVP